MYNLHVNSITCKSSAYIILLYYSVCIYILHILMHIMYYYICFLIRPTPLNTLFRWEIGAKGPMLIKCNSQRYRGMLMSAFLTSRRPNNFSRVILQITIGLGFEYVFVSRIIYIIYRIIMAVVMEFVIKINL